MVVEVAALGVGVGREERGGEGARAGAGVLGIAKGVGRKQTPKILQKKLMASVRVWSVICFCFFLVIFCGLLGGFILFYFPWFLFFSGSEREAGKQWGHEGRPFRVTGSMHFFFLGGGSICKAFARGRLLIFVFSSR